MEFIEWSESMSVGIPAIDQDHKVIVNLINLLHDELNARVDRKVLGSAINTLVDYTLFHFAREELIMAACRYPGIEDHKKQHHSLEKQVAEMANRYYEKQQDIVKEAMLEFLKSWLINHILKGDMSYRPYIEHNIEVKRLVASLQESSQLQQTPDSAALIPATIKWNELSVLLIGKSEHCRRMVSTILEIAQIREFRLSDPGAGALEVLNSFTPDLIIYRCHPDELEPLDFLSVLRRSPEPGVANLPVLLIDAYDDDKIAETLIDEGVTSCLKEPIGIKSLLKGIKELLESNLSATHKGG